MNARPRVSTAILELLLAMTSLACGGHPAPPPVAPPEPTVAAAPEPAPQMRVAGQLGSIDPGDVQKAFTLRLGALQQCHVDGLKRIRSLGGEVKVVLRIGEDGKARYGYFEDTTLGDHDVEACMMHVLTDAAWPRPEGGEAEVKNSFAFDPPAGGRVPEAWTSDAISVQLVEHHAKIRACKGKVEGEFKATAYITRGSAPKKPPRGRPKHPKAKPGASPPPDLRGKVLAVGIAPPGPEGIDVVDCLTGVILEMKVPNPDGPSAKVSFTL